MTRPRPRFRIRSIHQLDFDLIGQVEALTILTALGIDDPLNKFAYLIQQDAATIDGFFQVEARAPLTAERAAALQRLSATLARLRLEDRLGPIQRERINEHLAHRQPRPDLTEPIECFTYFQQSLGMWVVDAENSRVPLPRALAPAVRKAARLVFALDDFSMDALFNHLVGVLASSSAPPVDAESLVALAYCRDRWIEAADRAITEVPKAGPVGQRAVHLALSYLGPRYNQLTGKWPVFNPNVASAERHPFYGFTAALLRAAGHPQSFETLHRAIRLYCEARR